MNSDGSGAATLSGLTVAGGVAWSPDGNRMAYVGNSNGFPSLLVASNDGSGSSVLFQGTESFYSDSFAWSPDGRKIAFQGVEFGVFQGKIYVINVDGTGRTQVTDGTRDHSPGW